MSMGFIAVEEEKVNILPKKYQQHPKQITSIPELGDNELSKKKKKDKDITVNNYRMQKRDGFSMRRLSGDPNSIKLFLEDGAPGLKVETEILVLKVNKAYLGFCKDNGISPVSKPTFDVKMTGYGFKTFKRKEDGKKMNRLFYSNFDKVLFTIKNNDKKEEEKPDENVIKKLEEANNKFETTTKNVMDHMNLDSVPFTVKEENKEIKAKSGVDKEKLLKSLYGDVKAYISEHCMSSDEKYTMQTALYAHFVILNPKYKDNITVDEFVNEVTKCNYKESIETTSRGIRVRAIANIIPDYEYTIYTLGPTGMVKEYELEKARKMMGKVKEYRKVLIPTVHRTTPIKDIKKEDEKKVNTVNIEKDSTLNVIHEVQKPNNTNVNTTKFPKYLKNEDTVEVKKLSMLDTKADEIEKELNNNIEYVRMNALKRVVKMLRCNKISDEFLADIFYKSFADGKIRLIEVATSKQEIDNLLKDIQSYLNKMEVYHK